MKTKLALLGLIFLISCGAKEEADDTSSQADALYYKQKTLIIAYTDSILNHPDSISPGKFLDDLESRLFAESARYPQRVTEAISADQNDTLQLLSLKLIEVYKKSMSRALTPDTVPGMSRDSIGG